MDIQYIIDAYARVMYVASYMMKNEKGMGELLKHVAHENRSEELVKQLRKVGSAFLTHRELSAQEAAYRLLSLPMRQLSRAVVFINTNKKEEMIAVVKPISDLGKLDDKMKMYFKRALLTGINTDLFIWSQCAWLNLQLCMLWCTEMKMPLMLYHHQMNQMFLLQDVSKNGIHE